MTEFADLSSYQAGTDLAAYTRAGFTGVLIKLTQGADYPNPQAPAWWHTSGILYLNRGAYHYADATDPAAQARYFARAVANLGGLLPGRDWAEVDAEYTKYPSAVDGMRIVALVRELCALGLDEGVLYSYTAWLRDAGLTAAMLPARWRRLHIANYDPIPDGQVPLPPGWTWEQVVARQYSSKVPTAGVPAPCDRSRVIHEWLTTEDDMELSELDAAATAPGQKTFGGTVVATCQAAQSAVNAGNKAAAAVAQLAAEMAAMRTAVATLVDPQHPAVGPLTDPVGDLVTRVGGLELADAIRVNAALSARMAQLVPSTPAPGV